MTSIMEKEKEKSDLLMPTLESSVVEEISRFFEYSQKVPKNPSFSPIAKYNREKKKKENRPSRSLLNTLMPEVVEEEESLNIDNSAEIFTRDDSHEKLLFSSMLKDYAGGSTESDVEEEEYPERVPFSFDKSDEIEMARTKEYLEKKLKAICESPEYLQMKETYSGNTHSAKIIITSMDQKDKKPEDIHKGQKDKKLEDIQVTKNEISRKCSSQCRFTILSLSFLPVFLFLLYFGLSHINHAPDIVELEKEIFDHDKTVRVLTEYLQQDTPLFKVVALIGGTSVDKSHMNIIKKRNDNNLSFSSNIVVLKNLRAEHSIDVINFVRMYQEAYGNRQFIILVVFNIEQINDELTHNININQTINIVKHSFAEANIVSKIIPFKLLSEEILEKYIINTAKNIGRKPFCESRSIIINDV